MKKSQQRVSMMNKDEGAIDEGFFDSFLNLVVKKECPAGKAIEKKSCIFYKFIYTVSNNKF
jgi:hypothetical protein